MKRLISSILIAAFLAPSVAWSQDSVVEEPTIYPMNVGQPAPFPGVLFNKPATAKITVEYTSRQEEIDLAVKRAVADEAAAKEKIIQDQTVTCTREKAELSARMGTLDGTLKLKDEEITSLKAQIADAPSRSTWFTIGFASGFAATLLTVFAVGALTK